MSIALSIIKARRAEGENKVSRLVVQEWVLQLVVPHSFIEKRSPSTDDGCHN